MQERGELFTALFEYAVNGITTDFDNGQLTMAFSFLRAQIERDFTKYRNVCERNRQNANKKKQINQPFPVASSGSQYKEKDKNKEKDKEKDKEKNKRVDSLSADADAQPQTENKTYLLPCKNTMEPERFQNGSNLEPQIRLGKIRLDKDRVDSLSADADAQPRFDYQAVIDSYGSYSDYHIIGVTTDETSLFAF